LYNVIEDPSQRVNLVEKNQEIFNKMKPQMIKLLEEIKKEGPYWKGLRQYESMRSRFKKEYIR
jgi:Txe/YoeB family toxin of Txe-Axe toxin-antitoxin module